MPVGRDLLSRLEGRYMRYMPLHSAHPLYPLQSTCSRASKAVAVASLKASASLNHAPGRASAAMRSRRRGVNAPSGTPFACGWYGEPAWEPRVRRDVRERERERERCTVTPRALARAVTTVSTVSTARTAMSDPTATWVESGDGYAEAVSHQLEKLEVRGLELGDHVLDRWRREVDGEANGDDTHGALDADAHHFAAGERREENLLLRRVLRAEVYRGVTGGNGG